jgi:thiol-disulfide isomerase/thioredoxin
MIMRTKSMRTRCLALAAGGMLLAGAMGADAAERRVMYEQFTATWCSPCQYVGRAMNRLIQDYPDDMSAIQIHHSSSAMPFYPPWNGGRFAFYSVTGIPHVRIDGVYQQNGSVGNDDANYNALLSRLNQRLAVPTDLNIDIEATPVNDTGTYDVDVKLLVEAGGEAKTVRVYLVDVLYGFPLTPDDGRYHNCVSQAWTLGDYALTPGVETVVSQQLTFRTESWGMQDNIRLVAYAQDPLPSPPAEVFNSQTVHFPFGEPCPEDLNGDGERNLSDLGILLASYEVDDGGDIDGDGDTDLGDLGALLAVFDIPCP